MNDDHLWAESFDRPLKDIFAIQSTIAKEIATELHAAISPEEYRRLEYRPTENQEAYDHWVKFRQLASRTMGIHDQKTAHLELAVSLDHYGEVNDNSKARVLGEALDKATEKVLANRKSPSRKVNELDNRGSHFYLAMYWAEALAGQDADAELKAQFASIAQELSANEDQIVKELNDSQGVSVDMEGYYLPNEEKLSSVMRPSATLNGILAKL